MRQLPVCCGEGTVWGRVKVLVRKHPTRHAAPRALEACFSLLRKLFQTCL